MMNLSPTELLRDDLRKFGVNLIERPDYFTGKNRTITVVIDERIEYDTVIFEDALTVFMSTQTVYHILDVMRDKMYHKFIKDFMHAVNQFTKTWQLTIKPHGKYFWEVAINQVYESLLKIGIELNNFGMMEYLKCCRMFGGAKGFRDFIYRSLNQYAGGNIPKCVYCDYCRIDRNGNRRCSRVAVIVEHPKHHSRFMHILTLEKNASNYVDDIMDDLNGRDCTEFCPRNTKFMDRCVRTKNKIK